MDTLPEIVPVTDLRQDAAAVVKRVQRGNRPVVITQRGRAAAVLISLETYERTENERQILQRLIQGEIEIAQGTGYDLKGVLADADALLERDDM